MANLEKELLRLERELVDGSYRPGSCTTFTVKELKERFISAAPFRDRVVHHALCAVVEPLFERGFIADSYANRQGKGSHRAVARYEQYRDRFRHVLRCDIYRYFPSIDHEVMKRDLRRRIRLRRRLRPRSRGGGAARWWSLTTGESLTTMLSLLAIQEPTMAVLTIRNIDDAIKTGLRVQAARHGWSMEEEARRILAQALQGAHAEMPLGSRLRQHFAGVGALDISPRRPARAAPVFSAPRGRSK